MVRRAQKFGPKYISDSGIMPSHLVKSLSSASAALKPCNKIRVTSTLINQTTAARPAYKPSHSHLLFPSLSESTQR
eukprot:6179063-Pleurochrysis_carterae.AAC.1